MDKAIFNKLIVKIFMFYQSAKMPSNDQMNMWFEQVKHIPEQALEYIEKLIYKDRDSLPRNIPKAIIESYDNYPKMTSFFQYDEVEDLRFPVAKMIEGLGILQAKGNMAFYNFARAVRMPANDQDRVRMKAAILSGEQTFDISKIKGKIGNKIFRDSEQVKERIGVLKHQAEAILREPGDEIDENNLPF